jgi:hypothetical protein
MLAVAGIALLMGGAIEWSNYQKWAGEAELERMYLGYAVEHDRETAACRVKAVRNEPYAAILTRRRARRGGEGPVPPPFPPWTKAPAAWLEEGPLHADAAESWRGRAAKQHLKKMKYQRFWFVWIAD